MRLHYSWNKVCDSLKKIHTCIYLCKPIIIKRHVDFINKLESRATRRSIKFGSIAIHRKVQLFKRPVSFYKIPTECRSSKFSKVFSTHLSNFLIIFFPHNQFARKKVSEYTQKKREEKALCLPPRLVSGAKEQEPQLFLPPPLPFCQRKFTLLPKKRGLDVRQPMMQEVSPETGIRISE